MHSLACLGTENRGNTKTATASVPDEPKLVVLAGPTSFFRSTEKHEMTISVPRRCALRESSRHLGIARCTLSSAVRRFPEHTGGEENGAGIAGRIAQHAPSKLLDSMESVRVETALPVRSLTDVNVGQASVFMASMISFTLGHARA